MTEQEQLFAKFFNSEIELVKDMDDLTLRSHREELSRIAFEAKARLTAVGQETQERVAKNKKSKQFSTSLESDQLTTDAINTIKNREKKLNKTEKLIEQLMKLPGITRAQAEAMVNKTTIPVQIKTEVHKNEVKEMKEENKKEPEIKPVEDKPTPSLRPLFSGLGKKSES